MIDLYNLEKYNENNRIEAKKALGGLPHSLWETYSAFANTLGGLILLGVEEYKDKSLHAIDLPNPEKLVGEFWNLVNNPKKTSVNILSDKDVTVEMVDGKHIVVIRVPRADRSYKPVYIDGNPLNSYRRNGEGDYKCTDEELKAMYRDAAVRSQDLLVLEELDLSFSTLKVCVPSGRGCAFLVPGTYGIR
ncbi:MAG: ATP-binding protein [Clostridia bacterium]|nr:ATP-binding protein [Clostridia bacterium]